jgi:hypothetical protein
MRSASVTAIALAGALSIAQLSAQQPPAQGQPPAGGGQRMGGMMQGADAARKVPGGGITGAGWKGRIDPGEAKNGSAVNDSKFEVKGDEITITQGPAGIYWNPANAQTADYTVSATFTEPSYMSAMSHPHPYGLFVGGNKLDSDDATFLYCAAYGRGTFIVRGFGPGGTPFQMNGRGGTSEAVHKAAAKGDSVSQEISMSVKGSRVTCSINGTEVASYDKGEVTGAGKLESVEGIPGIRVAHNVDVKVTNFKVTK